MDNYIFELDARVRTCTIKKYNQILEIFGKSVDEKFKGNIEKYLKCRQMFATLCFKACKGKGTKLSDKQLQKYMKLKAVFRKVGELPQNFFTYVVKVDGKPMRVPKKVMTCMIAKHGFKFIKHGKSFSRNEHWCNFFMPKFKEAKRLYAIWQKYKNTSKENQSKESECTMTKAEKEEIKKECEEGKHAFPAEMLIKQQEKKERRETKRLMNISKKAHIELTSKITQLEAENEQLKAENQHLKQLKDLNSDIDEESQSELEQKAAEFEEAVKKGASQLPAECRSDNSDIPDFEEDSEEAEEVEFKPCSSAEFRQKLTAYEEKKEEEQEEALAARRSSCQHPEDDIPEDDIPQVDESQLLTQDKLQQMVDKQLVSKTFAQAIWKTVSGREACFNDSKNGWSVNDTQKKWKNECYIIQIMLDNISYYQLSSDDVAHWQKRQRILKQNAVSSL